MILSEVQVLDTLESCCRKPHSRVWFEAGSHYGFTVEAFFLGHFEDTAVKKCRVENNQLGCSFGLNSYPLLCSSVPGRLSARDVASHICREFHKPQLSGDSIRFARTEAEAETGTEGLSKLLRFCRRLLSASAELGQQQNLGQFLCIRSGRFLRKWELGRFN